MSEKPKIFVLNVHMTCEIQKIFMSCNNDTDGIWGPYIVEIQLELEDLNHKLHEVVDGPQRHAPRNIHTASTPRARQMCIQNQFSSTTGRYPSPSPRAKPIVTREREVITNYRLFPVRPNASARIFRPHKLQYPTYKHDKNVVPILLGGQKNNTLPE